MSRNKTRQTDSSTTESVPQDYLEDPVDRAYSQVQARLKLLSWRDFEELVKALLREAGFVDVQRLTSGSQQGRDIVAVWPSRFYLGRSTKFRIQVKHKPIREFLSKTEVGDSIADFLAQDQDEVLLIVSNAAVANDVLEQIDKLLSKGESVHLLTGARFLRFLCALGRIAKSHVGILESERQALHHTFEVRDWVEQLCRPEKLRFSFYRYWTEPYTWFFCRDSHNRTERYWTTEGGDFRLSLANLGTDIEQLGRILVKITNRRELPEHGVVNTTPKGGCGIPRTDVRLTRELGEIGLHSDGSELISPGHCVHHLVRFIPVDPGIYSFRIVIAGSGGNQPVRESEEFSIVSFGEDCDPWQHPDYVSVLESWPMALPVIETLLDYPPEGLRELRGNSPHCSAALVRDGEGYGVSLLSPDINRVLCEIGQLPVQHEVTDLLFSQTKAGFHECLRRMTTETEQVPNVFYSRSRLDEALDPSEPRGPMARAFWLKSGDRPKMKIVDAVEKAAERGPQRAKLAATYGCLCYSIGFNGFALFYLSVAYSNAPFHPTVAALYAGLLEKLNKPTPSDQQLESALPGGALSDFRRIREFVRKHPSFPSCANEAELEPFTNDDSDIANRRMSERW